MSAQRRSTRNRSTTTRLDFPNSSPTQQRPQPSSRKRKASPPAPEPAPQPTLDEEIETGDEADEETVVDFDEEDIQKDNQELADRIVPQLNVSSTGVEIAKTCSNEIVNEYSRGETISAYAKLMGRNWTYYIADASIRIGRPSQDSHEAPRKDEKIHVNLGPSKHVSRLHAELFFDEDQEEWRLSVHGNNGVRVDGERIDKGHSTAIHSGSLLTIVGTQMLFQTAHGKMHVYQEFMTWALEQIERVDTEKADAAAAAASLKTYAERPNKRFRGDNSPASYYPVHDGPEARLVNGHAHNPFVSAYGARPITPEPSQQAIAPKSSAKKRSPTYAKRGIMIESTEQIDYSLDSNKDIKPGCSYAAMITWAILSSPDHAISLNGVYEYIKAHFAHYRLTPSGWQNSVRHNLSLNAAFEKTPRRADAPGKGMLWRIVPEQMDITIAAANKNASKGGGRTSSAPGSPAGGAVTGGFAPTPAVDGTKPSPSQGTPPLSSYPTAQQESYTPTRGPQMPIYAPTQGSLPVLSDRTPSLPSRRRANGHLTTVNSSPTLTSGHWMNEPTSSMRTPAPRPHNLNVPQPNTARLPTSHMADSSPAPFWRFGDGLGSTPAGAFPEISPLKNGNGITEDLPSSSPPPMANGIESPSRRTRRSGAHSGLGAQNGQSGQTLNENGDDEDGEIDLARGFTRISTYHQQRNNAAASKGAAP